MEARTDGRRRRHVEALPALDTGVGDRHRDGRWGRSGRSTACPLSSRTHEGATRDWRSEVRALTFKITPRFDYGKTKPWMHRRGRS